MFMCVFKQDAEVKYAKQGYHFERKSKVLASILLFSKLNHSFFGYFDPGKIFFDNENK